MNAPRSFSCPNCSAPLHLPDTLVPAVTCTYCSSTVIVPAEIRRSTAMAQPAGLALQSLVNFAADAADVLVRVTELAEAGDKEQAIQLFRETFDVSQEAAVEAVNQLAAGKAASLPSLSVRQSAAQSPAPATIDLSGGRRLVVSCAVFALVLIIAVSIIAPIALTAWVPFQIESIIENVETINLGTIEPGESFNLNPPLFLQSATPTPGLVSQQRAFGNQGTGPSNLLDPRHIAVDEAGNIFVADHAEGRLQRFDPQGLYLNGWITSTDDYTFGMDVERDGTVYLIVQGDLFIYRGNSGELVQKIEPDPYFTFEDVAAAGDGSIVLVADNDTLVWMDSSGHILRSVEDVISRVEPDGELDARMALDRLGKIYLLGRFTSSVFVYSTEGEYLSRFGSDGDEPGQFRAPMAIAVDTQGRIYVSDIKGIQVFDNTGRYLALITLPRVAFGLDFNDRNELFVVTNLPQVILYRLNEP